MRLQIQELYLYNYLNILLYKNNNFTIFTNVFIEKYTNKIEKSLFKPKMLEISEDWDVPQEHI